MQAFFKKYSISCVLHYFCCLSIFVEFIFSENSFNVFAASLMVMWLLVTMLALLLFSLAFLSIFLADEDAHIAMFLLCKKLTNLRKMELLISATLPPTKYAHLEQLRFHRRVRLFVRFSWNLSPKSVRFSIVLGIEVNKLPNFDFFVVLGISRYSVVPWLNYWSCRR